MTPSPLSQHVINSAVGNINDNGTGLVGRLENFEVAYSGDSVLLTWERVLSPFWNGSSVVVIVHNGEVVASLYKANVASIIINPLSPSNNVECWLVPPSEVFSRNWGRDYADRIKTSWTVPDGLTSLSVMVNGAAVKTFYQPIPANYQTAILNSGTYTVGLAAVDVAGNSDSSAVSTVKVNTPPLGAVITSSVVSGNLVITGTKPIGTATIYLYANKAGKKDVDWFPVEKRTAFPFTVSSISDGVHFYQCRYELTDGSVCDSGIPLKVEIVSGAKVTRPNKPIFVSAVQVSDDVVVTAVVDDTATLLNVYMDADVDYSETPTTAVISGTGIQTKTVTISTVASGTYEIGVRCSKSGVFDTNTDIITLTVISAVLCPEPSVSVL